MHVIVGEHVTVSMIVMTHSVNKLGETAEVGTMYVRDVPDELHTAVKVEAAHAGVSMRQLVLDALEREVERLRAERGETAKGKGRT